LVTSRKSARIFRQLRRDLGSFEDNGIGSLNPLTAGFLGIAGSLSGRRVATDDQINIVIQTPEGLIGSRPLQLQWRNISETAVAAAGPSQ
jgi:hypothetical protein